MKALVLLSGGIDSTVCLAKAVAKYGSRDVATVSFTYGQKHRTEIEAAIEVAHALHIRPEDMHFINIPHWLFGDTSALMNDAVDMPEKSYQELRESQGPSPAYVPFRNAVLISQAVALGMGYGAKEVWYGAHASDAHNFAYPDCTPEFNGALAAAVYVGTNHQVRLVMPLQWMQKSEVVAEGLSLGAPLELTHSCYNGKPACGKCPTCIERQHAFACNNRKDPALSFRDQ